MAKLKREFTKCAVDARKTAGLTQEEAADIIGCSVNTLQKYEADELRIHDDMADRMAMVYHDPRLRRLYCEHECAIGCRDGHRGVDRTMEALLLDLTLFEPGEARAVAKTLRDITADGIIEKHEEADLTACIAYLDQIAKTADALKLQVLKAAEGTR